MRRVAAELMATAAPLADQKALILAVEIADGMRAADGRPHPHPPGLWNIIGNAIKFTDHGGIAVSIQPDADNVLFCVADTGIGITPGKSDAHIRILQPDRCRPARIDQRHRGWVVCSISKSLVEYHGGRKMGESRPGSGSTFRFTIPTQAERGDARHSTL